MILSLLWVPDIGFIIKTMLLFAILLLKSGTKIRIKNEKYSV
jgi:hypothetical protein